MYQLSVHGTGYCSAFEYPTRQRHKLRVLLNHVLDDLSHARMWTSGDLTRWASDFAIKSSVLKFWINHRRGNLYVLTSSALTSSPSAQSPPFSSPTSANKTGLRIYRSRTERVIRVHISVQILLTGKSAVKLPVLTCRTCILCCNQPFC